MDSAVWGMQAVVDRRRQEREADATAYRQARQADSTSGATGRQARPAIAVPEPAGDDLELVGAGESR